LFTYVVLAVTSFGTLSRTWWFGFHTLRQILYGALLGVASHYTVVILLASAKQSKNGPLVISGIVTIGILFSGKLVTFYTALPLTNAELLLGTVMWGVIASYSWYKYNSKEKTQ